MAESHPGDDATHDLSLEQFVAGVSASFETAWQSALRGSPEPDLETQLARIDETRRPVVREALEKIDQQYRSRLDNAAKDRPTVGDGSDVTVETSLGAEGATGYEATLDIPPGDGYEETLDGTARSATAARRAFPQIPGYQITGELGRGAMGVVYRARQIGLNRIVALKMILSGGHAGPEHKTRFQAEAQAVAQLQHPGIVQVHDVGEHDGLPYFSLEFVDGRPLDQEIAGQPVLPERAADLVEEIARAMHYAHQHGIVHRDLKPANILLTAEGRAKVSDFGLVKRLEDDSSQTRTGTILGTPSYMSPEQASGIKEVGPLADVYALGALLYCLLTGRPPFAAATPLDTVMQVIREEPVAPSVLQPKTPIDLETICLKCLQKEPAKRYTTAADLADDLKRYQDGEPILARPVTTRERVWRWCKRNPRVALLSAAASILALVLMTGGPAAAVVLYRLRGEAVAAQKLAETNESLANRERQKAEENAEQARINAEIAEENAQIAQENEAKAREAEDQAIQALQSLVFEAQKAIGRQPRMQQLRRRLLDIAVNGLQLRERQNAELEIGLPKAGAHKRLAIVYSEIGQFQKAQEQIQLCIQAVETAVAAGKLVNPTANLGLAYEVAGDVARAGGDALQARSHYETALEYFREWEQDHPPSLARRVQHEIAEAYGKVGDVAFRLGDFENGRRYFESSFAIRKEWADRHPEDFSAQRELAGAYSTISEVSLRLGKIEQAQRELQQGITLLRELEALDPGDHTLPWNIALQYLQLGAVSLMDQDAELAKQHFETAFQILEPMLENDAQDATLRGNVAQACYGLGVALEELNEGEASGYLEQSRQLAETLARDDPYNMSRKSTLMLSLARCGFDERAMELAQELFEHSPDDPALLFKVACGRALSAAAVERRIAADSSSQAEMALREDYLAQALTALRAAVEHGYRDVALLRLDPDLAPLRDHPPFTELIDQLEAAPPAETPSG